MFLNEWSVRRPIAMSAFIIVLVMLGLNAYRKLSIDLMPSIEIPYIMIRTEYQGGSPEEIEVEVARRIEDAVASLEGLRHISNICMENECRTSLEFNMGANVDIAATDVREKLNRIRDDFPEGVTEPTIRKIDNNATAVVQIYLTGDATVDQLYDYADDKLADRFSSIPGVGEVRVVGANEMQVHILVDRQKLAATNLTMADIIKKLEANNVKIPAGRIRGDGREVNLTFDGEFKSFDDIASLEIGKHQNKRVYMRDVATAKLISREARSRSFVNGKPAASLRIIKRGDANAVQVINNIRAKFEEVKRKGELPGGMELVWFRDAGEFIHASVDDAWNSIVIGIALTAVLLFLFLHELRSTFIVMVSMPISVAVTFGLMQYLDYTFNIMTLLSLGCSVGVLVTNSIVVIENIFRHMDRGEDSWTAANKGTGEVITAVAASALTNVVVFVPVAMMTTRTGRQMAPFAGVMVAATIVSLFISFTLTPILAGLLLKKYGNKKTGKTLLEKMFIPWDRGYDALTNAFARSVEWTAKHAKLVLLLTAILCAAIYFFIVPQVGMSFMPKADQGEISVRIEYPTNFNLDANIERTQKAVARIQQLPFVRGVSVNIGNVSGSGGQVSNAVYLAELLVKVTGKTERRETLPQLVEKVRSELDYMENCIITFSTPRTDGGGGGAADIPMRISGSSLEELERIGKTVQMKVRDLKITSDLDTSIRVGKPNINITPRRPVLQNMGIEADTLSSSVRGTYEGIEVGTYRLGNRSFDIRVKQTEEPGLQQVYQLAIGSQNGNPLNINVLADLTEDVRSVCINRYDKERAIWIYANTAPGKTLGEVVKVLRETAQSQLPPGYGARFIGQVERMGETSLEFVEVILLAIMLTYLLICALMESWTRPFLIMFTVPLGFLGMYLTLYLAGMSMSMMGLLGGVMMIGIVVNNAILIMDDCAMHVDNGMSAHAAMKKAASEKFRPIVMTSIASVAGMLPMAFGTGLGSELRSSCGMGVVGGLTFASILTLYVIPAMYFVFVKDKVKEKKDRTA
ncbi:MAG: efflux RND transporter permease subunit [Lentisphaeria bacterium]|nr:efflux RND transporter permease subunit [Lentisphaeria bacterium]